MRDVRATLRQIAKHLRVSETTVSRALSGQARRYRISAATELAIQKLASEFNFVPNQLARGLRLQKTHTIGLVIPDISNPFFAGIARQIALATRAHGYAIVLCDSQDDVGQEREAIALLRSRQVEGIVLCPVGQTAEHLTGFASGGLPIVLVDRFFPKLLLPYVASDNFAGAKAATNFLIEHGHRRIACLQGLRGTSPNDFRVQGYQAALREHHIPVDTGLLVGDQFSEQSGYIETKLLLRSSKNVTAILALSNLNALGVLRALAEERRKIPADMSLISFDDQSYLSLLATPMTVVAQQHAELGVVAAKLLFDQIQTPQRAMRDGILLPTTLMVRSSVKTLVARRSVGQQEKK